MIYRFVKLLVPDVVIGNTVHSAGDIVELADNLADVMIRRKHAELCERPEPTRADSSRSAKPETRG